MEWPGSFLNWPVGIYLLLVLCAFVIPPWLFANRRKSVRRRREQAGLPDGMMMDNAERLETIRWEAGVQAGVLLIAVLVVPILIFVFDWTGKLPAVKGGLLMVFLAIVVWILTQGADAIQAFMGGLAFKTLVALEHPIQVGDRVTLKDHGGKVLKIGIFYVTLGTPDDDLISIPTHQLWSDVLVSTNAGDRSSLCVMPFYLAPFASQAQRQRAEDSIWDAIQASPYCETGKPMQIFLSQTEGATCLTAKAYVTSTYDEPLFKSDVTRAFLDVASHEDIPLGMARWGLSGPGVEV